MNRNIILKDGTIVLLRHLKSKDKNQLSIFFKSLPNYDRVYLRRDITDKETVGQIIRTSRSGEIPKIIALDKNRIIAYGLIEIDNRHWKYNSAELRLLVSKDYRRKGLGMLISRELYSLAINEKIEEIIVKMMKPQKAAISIFKRLGFKQKAVIPDYVIDFEGNKQDLIIMNCNVEEMWRELEEYMQDSDWQRTR
jgi:L-amino acid N-acyltransferase YncA